MSENISDNHAAELRAAQAKIKQLEAERDEVLHTLVLAAIPLEVLYTTGNDYRLKKLRRDYDRLISPEVRASITEAVEASRRAITCHGKRT